MNRLVDIDALNVSVQGDGAELAIIEDFDFVIDRGETVCLVGESGSGKTMAALALMRLGEQKGAKITGGRLGFGELDLATLSQAQMNQVRGARIGMIFQEPMTAFDPLFTVGQQIAEVMLCHGVARDAQQARHDTIALLERVRIPAAHLRADQYPHQLSGGMRQRSMIAMALACRPELLIADEPTTALDVTIQAQILELLQQLQRELNMAILLITHDLGVAAQIADRVVVMYAGEVVEHGSTADIFSQPRHPYTRGLLDSIVGPDTPRHHALHTIRGTIPMPTQRPGGCRFHPRCEFADDRCKTQRPPLESTLQLGVACWYPLGPLGHAGIAGGEGAPVASARQAGDAHPITVPAGRRRPDAPPSANEPPLLEIRALHKHFALRRQHLFKRPATVRAVDDVSFEINTGETFGLVGESGCGKSTLARVLMQLDTPTSGDIRFNGHTLGKPSASSHKNVQREMQMVFQDPHGSLNARWNVGALIEEPLQIHTRLNAAERRRIVENILGLVGIDPSWYDRYPHSLSGGQRQRIAIARAIVLNPKLVVADEAVSALDVSVQGQVINLLQDLKQTLNLTYLFIGHGLNVVRYVSDRIGVMYLGRLVETGPAEEVFRHPAHHYTRALIDAIPVASPHARTRAAPIAGEMPSPTEPPAGCRFHTRCPAATQRCKQEDPPPVLRGGRHVVSCHFPL